MDFLERTLMPTKLFSTVNSENKWQKSMRVLVPIQIPANPIADLLIQEGK